MKLLPFRRSAVAPRKSTTEDRQQGPYTDAITAAILSAATGQAGERILARAA